MSEPSQRPARSTTPSLVLPEHEARRLTLAQAVETSDTRGFLLSTVEREAIDRQVVQSVKLGPGDAPADVEGLLRARAAQVLQVVENRSPALAAFQHRRPALRWLAVAVPLAAVALGAFTDRIANPHRVDLLSLPLLAILGWNLVVYTVLAGTYMLQRPRKRPRNFSVAADLAQRLANWHPRMDALQARVMAGFSHQWFTVTSALQGQRLRKVLHLAAAGWAMGVVLSLFARGLVVEYRVGWESTFLDAAQVHAILRVLLSPVLWLLPFQPFSAADIAALRFGEGTPLGAGAVAGPRWVYLYASLLALIVMVPRVLLALWARWREHQLAGRVVLDLDSPYYRRIVAMTNPARIHLGLMAAHDDDHNALLRVLQPHGLAFEAGERVSHGASLTLMRASSGEALFADRMAITASAAASPQAKLDKPGWAGSAMARLRGMAAAPAPARTAGAASYQERDAVLLVLRSADDMDAALPALRQWAGPTLLLVNPASALPAQREADLALTRTRANALAIDAEALSFDSFARCWVQQPVLLEAIARCLPAAKKEGFARLLETRMQRQRERFGQSMEVIAEQLHTAAREIETVRRAPPSVTRLIKSSDRLADARARADATAALVERLRASSRQTLAALLRLHGIEGKTGSQSGQQIDAADLLEPSFADTFRHTAPVNAREAGMAGAATGAATGASVDLITGGLTLGAAAALGALLGGGAAVAGAAWKNRSTPLGIATVQLSDEMLHALLDASLLLYLSIVHLEGQERGTQLPGGVEAGQAWAAAVAIAVAPHREKLARLWFSLRQSASSLPANTLLANSLATEIRLVARELLHALYPAAPLTQPERDSS